jgi:hypothetical protein
MIYDIIESDKVLHVRTVWGAPPWLRARTFRKRETVLGPLAAKRNILPRVICSTGGARARVLIVRADGCWVLSG